MSYPAWVTWRIYRHGGVWAWAARSERGRMEGEGFTSEAEAREALIRALRAGAAWEE